jgi:YidC/Oxa1 family membrane protein insertase
MSFTQRLALASLISLGILFVYSWIFPPVPPDPLAEADASAETGSMDGTGGEEAVASAPDPTQEKPATPATASEVAADAERVEVTLSGGLLEVELANSAHGLLSRATPTAPQFAEADGRGLDFLELGDERSLALDFDTEATDFAWSRRDPTVVSSDGRFEVVQSTPEVEVRQTLVVDDGYQLTWRVSVVNRTGSDQRHRLRVRTRMGQPEEADRWDIHRALCKTADGVEDFDRSDLEDEEQRVRGGVKWIALDRKYFVQAVVGSEPFAECVTKMSEDGRTLEAVGAAPTATVAPGQTQSYEFHLYLGAKEDGRLAAFDAVPNAGLEDAIDWGWFGTLSKGIGKMMLALLRWFHNLVGIWGWAIVMLTCVVKLVTLPLTLKQYRSMRRMREIQPEMEKVKEKYKDDRTKQSQEMQALFQRMGVNPLAGCVPMVIQFPVWIALYAMLGTVVELYHEPFLWLPDLTKADPLYILPVAMGALMFLQMRMQPATDNQQAQMMQKIMPAFFVVMMLFLPSGLGVYIFANIVLSLIQSFIQLRPKANAEPAPA